ncbi:MAG: prephenate dehydrogenase [Sphingobacteriales bacterium]|nr:MAG: prephenate dehydrogenase [Sphingobacteriales bacterium]
MIVSVIGLGLIGGSVSLDLKARGFTNKIIGYDANEGHARLAVKRGIADETVQSINESVQQANLVILAVPVKEIIKLLPEVLDVAGTTKVVLDMGSTKQEIVNSVKDHPNRISFVATHPMAGTEFSGPSAAIYNLFDRKVAIICNKEHSHPDSISIVESMYHTLNMPIVYMDAHEHDLHTAYISHISHITSFALANTVLIKEKSVSNIFHLASGGFSSTVRLAKSSPNTWVQIFEQNRQHVLEVLDAYIGILNKWKLHLSRGEFEEVYHLMEEANEIGKILNK